jgi:hypothetical protein
VAASRFVRDKSNIGGGSLRPLLLNVEPLAMKAKVIIGVVLLLVSVVAALMVSPGPEEPIQVLGALSKREIPDIRKAVWYKTHPPILSGFSAQNILATPGLMLRRFWRPNPKIYRMEARTHGFVAVFGRSAADAQTHRYIFWCVFRETNGWAADAEYHLADQ